MPQQAVQSPVNIEIIEPDGRFLATVPYLTVAYVSLLPVLEPIGDDIKNIRHWGTDHLEASNGLSIDTVGKWNL